MKELSIWSGAFITVLLIHFGITCLGFYYSYGRFDSLTIGTYFYSYVNALKLYEGLALALISFFIAFAFLYFKKTNTIKSIRSGVIIATTLFLSLYLAFGIHFSTPMFNVWNHIIGYFYIQLQLLVFFALTSISVVIGSIIIWIKSRKFLKKESEL